MSPIISVFEAGADGDRTLLGSAVVLHPLVVVGDADLTAALDGVETSALKVVVSFPGQDVADQTIGVAKTAGLADPAGAALTLLELLGPVLVPASPVEGLDPELTREQFAALARTALDAASLVPGDALWLEHFASLFCKLFGFMCPRVAPEGSVPGAGA